MILGSPATNTALASNGPHDGASVVELGASATTSLSRALLIVTIPNFHVCADTYVTIDASWRLVATFSDVTIKQLLLLPKIASATNAMVAGQEFVEVGSVVIKMPSVETAGDSSDLQSMRRQQQLFLIEQDTGCLLRSYLTHPFFFETFSHNNTRSLYN